MTVYIPDGSALAVQSSMRHSHPLPSAASPLPVCAAVISATAVADVSVLTTDVQTPACSSSRPRVLVPQPTCSTAQASPAAGRERGRGGKGDVNLDVVLLSVSVLRRAA